ncbi:MAG TPA: polymer-forming cytoskeletal protein [Rhodanobacteraceae bacterium]|nr:polymer-forming cytoskeletal protein [Rhodanobacteraceae bacterium]
MFSNNQRKSGDHHHGHGHASDTSLIARGTTIRGDVEFSGALHLDGSIEGAVLAADDGNAVFTLSAEGQVVGEVRVPNAVINGTVKGNIVASERLELAAQARVEGDVHYRVLEMAAGAEVNGRMMRLADEPPRQLTGPASEAADETSEQEALLTDAD